MKKVWERQEYINSFQLEVSKGKGTYGSLGIDESIILK